MRYGTKSKLSDPIYYEGNSSEERIKNGLKHFSEIFLKKEIKPEYRNKMIFFDMSSIYKRYINLGMPERFAHIISLDNEDKYTVDPCNNNDISIEQCENGCNDSKIFKFQNYGRWECLYRLYRVHWVREVIDLANQNDPDIITWQIDDNDGYDHFQKEKIRYHCGMDDYLIVLKDRKKIGDYMFITAFPVASKRKKDSLNREYNTYLKSLESKK